MSKCQLRFGQPGWNSPWISTVGTSGRNKRCSSVSRTASRGCSFCHHTGYRGRLGIFEYLPVNDEFRELIVAGASLGQLREKAATFGMTSLREAGISAMLAGETTLEEVARYT